ncbi:type II secretion system protein [Geopsychrobacter electrodiphilus]|uniref:type II secretion system protein n=1 Tax=Geopsychrobacter electrodiphilus TaxID=225196 RepID=UPI0003727382|nr:type II secretion system protein [Geopsychrobacter electrodiphilus]
MNLFLKRLSCRRGLTLLEMVIAMGILAILATAIVPYAEITVQRTKEMELRRALRTIRTALDEYKADYDKAVKEKKIIATVGESGYPPDLMSLVEGNDWGGLYENKHKYLRRIPQDPFDDNDEGWGFRSYADDYDSTVWGGEDIYDVHSQSTKIGLDGTPYSSW